MLIGISLRSYNISSFDVPNGSLFILQLFLLLH